MRPRLAPLLLLCGLLGCGDGSPELLLLNVGGLGPDITALRVDAQLADAPATEVKEVRRGLDRFALGLPAASRGRLRLQVDALDGDRCVTARGFAETTLAETPWPEASLALRRLEQPLCRCSATGWCWESPLPQGNHLRAVFSVSETDAWAVGDFGTILRWDGARWRDVPSGTIANLFAVWAGSERDAWAVGERGTVLRWDGSSWIVPANRPSVTADLEGVWGVPGGDVWAVGDDGIVLRASGGSLTVENAGSRLRLRAVWVAPGEEPWVVGDDGLVRQRSTRGWLPPTGASTSRPLYSVAGGSARELWVVGEMGTILHIKDGDARDESVVQPIDLNGVFVTQPDGSPPPPATVWAVGAPRGLARATVLRRREGAWAPEPLEEPEAGNVLTAIHGTAAGDLWMVGLYGTLLRRRGAEDLVLGTRDTTRVLRAVYGSGAEDVWAIGSQEGLPTSAGTLLRWDGTAWRSLSETVEQGPGLLSLTGTGPTDVWATGRGGLVLHWDGVTWRPEDVSALTRADLAGVWAGGGEVWAAGTGAVLRRAGGAWGRIEVGPDLELGCVAGFTGAAVPEVWLGGADPQGRGVLLRRAGDKLSEVQSDAFGRVLTIAGSGPRDVWAAIDKGPMLRWDGARFQAIDTGTTRSLRGLWFFGPSDGWAVGEEGRIFFWNGASWVRQISGTTNDLEAAFGTSLRNLWIVGSGGTILRQRL